MHSKLDPPRVQRALATPSEPAANPPGMSGMPGIRGARFGDYVLDSHFQPIFSLPHHRLIGHEALLRASDWRGDPVSPAAVFAGCTSERELTDCDRLSRLLHLGNYASRPHGDEWLFLNVHPLAFERLAQPGSALQLADLQRQFNMPEGSIVFEVLEAETADPVRLAEAIAVARAAGMLIAIDDFGAGHSNFDRVWRMQPDIVKVDRCLVARAATDYSARRILAHVVSLLHECGTMVLLEGIETRDEALVAIDCDAEMIQGYFVGRPQSELVPSGHRPAELTGLREVSQQVRERDLQRAKECAAPYLVAMTDLAHTMWQQPDASAFARACQPFLALPHAETCYLLDHNGYQLGENIWAESFKVPLDRRPQPLRRSQGACWGQRPYLRRALEFPGQAQITRPYRTLNGHHLCATVSIAFSIAVDGVWETRVACGDFRWQEWS